MIISADNTAVSGGGLKGASGTNSFDTASQTRSISTGLKNLKSFVVYGTMPQKDNKKTMLEWNEDDPTNFLSFSMIPSHNYGGYGSAGSYPSGTYGAFTMRLDSIDVTNGDIVLRASSQGSGYQTINFDWFAVGE